VRKIDAMSTRLPRVRSLSPSLLVLAASALPAQDPPPSRAVEHVLSALPQSRYFLIPPRDLKPDARPDGARGLLVVLPGGPGSADFLPFVENSVHAQAPELWCAMVVAPRWTDDQQIVWPTERSKVKGMRYPTEAYVRAVADDVAKGNAIDATRRYLLVWSSSGPAAWALLLSGDSPFRGAYVAMSVWPQALPAEVARSKGLRVLLDQSPEDTTTRFLHVRQAYDALAAAGAVVRLSTYRGGHGWKDDPLPRLRRGLDWLRGSEPAPPPVWPDQAPPATGKNLLQNGGFESGDKGWTVANNSGTLKTAVEAGGKDGRKLMHLQKTGGAPLDLVFQEVSALPKDGQVMARAWVKTKGCKNAWVKCFLYKGDEVVHQDVDLAQLHGDADWQQVSKTWDVAGADRAVFQIVLVLGGEVWIDGCELAPVVAK
jgi:predicted esterase